MPGFLVYGALILRSADRLFTNEIEAIGAIWSGCLMRVFCPIFYFAVAVMVAAAVMTNVGVAVLPTAWMPFVKTLGAGMIVILTPLAALFDIAPPFITRFEVRHRNERAAAGSVQWEDVPFLYPFLKRVRPIDGWRRWQGASDEQEADRELTPASRPAAR